ncbi:hypothetical protein F5Y03DRAFT_339957 [Xylaria venustula]|nr:hypothetical protein F5Y03DRAFT_339957 [Xylaria venustula]
MREKMQESLMSIYSWLRNIETIMIVVYHEHRGGALTDSSSYITLPLNLYDMSYDTLLKSEDEIVNWCTTGQMLQQMICNKIWRERNH